MSTRPAIAITGGAKRIGAALSRYFAQQGYDIALHYNSSAALAHELKDEIEAMGVSCHLFQQDLMDTAMLPAFMAKLLHTMPNCQALINNASVFERASFQQTDEALFDRQFNANFKAPFFLSQAFATDGRQGAIINILDTEIVGSHGSHFAYLLSKKALAEFTTMAARALGPNVRVNAVCPGCILPSDQNEEAYEKKVEAVIPLRSHPGTDDVAQAVYWLVSQAHITGQLIFVDGGKHVL